MDLCDSAARGNFAGGRTDSERGSTGSPKVWEAAVIRERPPWPGDIERLRRARLPAKDHGDRVCRLCARTGLPNNRFSWHPRCARLINAIWSPYASALWCLRRQRGLCPCGKVLGELQEVHVYDGRDCETGTFRWMPLARAYEIDHVVPLWQVAMMPEERRTIRWWLPGNLQVVCVPCHRAKTKLEARERASIRSPQEELFA